MVSVNQVASNFTTKSLASSAVSAAVHHVRIADAAQPSNFINIKYFPVEYSDEWQPNYEESSVMGSVPVLGYSSSSLRKLSFTLQFVCTFPSATLEVKNKVDWLRTYLDPVYKNGTIYPPKRLKLHIGFAQTFEVVLMAAPVTWKSPWEMVTHHAMLAEISLDFVVLEEFPHTLTPATETSLKLLRVVDLL